MMSSSTSRIFARKIINSGCLARVLQTHQPHHHQQQSKRFVQQQSSTSNESTDKYSYYSPAEGYVRTSPFDAVEIPTLTLEKYVWEHFKQWENKICTTCIVSGREYTYARLRDHSAVLAIRLQQKFKLKPRDVVAISMPNIPEYPIAFLGSVEAGLTCTTVNPMYTPEEIGRQLATSDAKFVFGTVSCFSALKEACKHAKKRIPICCIRTNKNDSIPEGAVDFFELVDPAGIDFSQLMPTDIGVNDVVCLPFSSGTTGLPKGVMLSHQNLTVNMEMVHTTSQYPLLFRHTCEEHQDVCPGILPFFHIYGMSVVLLAKMRLGMKIVTMPRFNPEDFIRSLGEYKGSILHLVPPIVLFLTNSPKVMKKHLEQVSVVMSGAAPIGALDVERLIKKYPHVHFVQGFGMTETSPVVMMGHAGLKKYASVGAVTANTEAKIASFDSENREGLPPNAIGEVCVRGPQVMLGYFKNEEATKEIMLPGNWLRTGDVGYYDEEGYFFITDRMKELIKVKGFQVPPAELEELLRDHPKIADAAVVGAPHEQYGEVPRAFVVLRPGSQATEKEIQEFVDQKVAVYKKLEGGVTFLDEIPKNVSGKILRRELKNKYCS